jgi:hypothetical protein
MLYHLPRKAFAGFRYNTEEKGRAAKILRWANHNPAAREPYPQAILPYTFQKNFSEKPQPSGWGFFVFIFPTPTAPHICLVSTPHGLEMWKGRTFSCRVVFAEPVG